MKIHIDSRILENISCLGYDGTRQYLYDNILKFSKTIKVASVDFDNGIDLESIATHRERRIIEYVLQARTRISDLYRIERDLNKFGFGPKKTFELFLFINRIKGN